MRYTDPVIVVKTRITFLGTQVVNREKIFYNNFLDTIKTKRYFWFNNNKLYTSVNQNQEISWGMSAVFYSIYDINEELIPFEQLYQYAIEYFRESRDLYFRDGPVPRTGKRTYGRYYRRMHTFAERRENEFLEFDDDAIEYGITPRYRRVGHNLPDVWDDCPRSNYKDRSWKRYRKTQWKG